MIDYPPQLKRKFVVITSVAKIQLLNSVASPRYSPGKYNPSDCAMPGPLRLEGNI